MSEAAATAPVLVRPLTRADLDEVMRIERAAFTTPWRPSTFEGLLARSDTNLFAATCGGRLVGYAVCWTVVDQAELGNVAVDPEFRGRGIGRRLVDEVLQCVRARGAAECFLEVRESNRGAQELYVQRGFRVVGRRKRYYTHPVEDALVMRVGLA